MLDNNFYLMLADKSSRRRQFSDIRSVYKSEKSLSPYCRKHSHTSSRYIPVEQNKTTLRDSVQKQQQTNKQRSITPIKKRQFYQESTGIKTPTKSSRKINFKTPSPIHLVSHNLRGYQQILNKSQQKLKPLEYCLGCTNQYLCENKKKENMQKQKKEEEYYTKFIEANNYNTLKIIQEQQIRKNRRNRSLLECNLEQIAQKQDKKAKQNKTRIENQRIQNQEMEDANKLFQQTARMRSYKQQAFKRDILEQIQEDKKRKRMATEEEKKWEPSPCDVSNEIRQRDRYERKQRQYRLELISQIQQKQEKAKKDKERERREQQASDLQNMRESYANKYSVNFKKNRQYERQLQDQIISNHIQKRKVKQAEDRQFNQMHKAMLNEAEQEARMSRKIGEMKMNRYLSDLKSQISDNKAKRIKEKQFERVPSFAPLCEVQKQILEECDRCHKEYPLKYMSIIEPA